jgi:hypothetical protein
MNFLSWLAFNYNLWISTSRVAKLQACAASPGRNHMGIFKKNKKGIMYFCHLPYPTLT